MFTAVCLIHSF